MTRAIERVFGSLETIPVRVADIDPASGAGADLSGVTVAAAMLAEGSATAPADATYTAVSWNAGTKTIDGVTYYIAEVQIGPGGDITPAAVGTYVLYLKVTAIGETPILRIGEVVLA